MLHISKEEIKKQAEQIFKPIKYGECGVAICYPCCKISYNLSCFLQDRKILKATLGNLYKRFIFISICLEHDDNEVIFLKKVNSAVKSQKIHVGAKMTLQQIIEKILVSGKEPYFFLLDAHLVPTKKLGVILNLIHSQILMLNRVRTIVFFESNIHNEETSLLLQKNNKFLQNALVFPTYSFTESKRFLQNLSRDWKMNVAEKMVKTLAQNFCGYLWLLREGLRQVRENNKITIKEIIECPGIQIRLETIYNSFTEEEKNALVELSYSDSQNVSNKTKQYLISVGVISIDNKRCKLSLPALEPFIKKRLASNKFQALPEENKILMGGKDVSLQFTTQELQVMMLLINKREQLVSREEIAKSMWNNSWEDRYSEWAIDKLMSRIRSVLTKLKMPKNIIITKKSQGFVMN